MIDTQKLAAALWNVTIEDGWIELGPIDRAIMPQHFMEVAEHIAQQYQKVDEAPSDDV